VGKKDFLVRFGVTNSSRKNERGRVRPVERRYQKNVKTPAASISRERDGPVWEKELRPRRPVNGGAIMIMEKLTIFKTPRQGAERSKGSGRIGLVQGGGRSWVH